MKTLLTFLLPILFISTILFNDTNAQVTVSGATAGNGNYTTLAASFNAINAGAQTGPNIFITITANTAEPATGAVLNNGTWTSLTIQPNATGRTISANVTGGLALVDLNGADRVTIDGMAFTNFTFSNTSISATADKKHTYTG